MAVDRSRTAEPLEGAPHGATMGTWGMWLAIVALALLVAGFASAALYLDAVQDAWPPEDIPPPTRVFAAVAVALTAVAAGACSWALIRLRAGGRRPAAIALAVGIASSVGAIVTLAADLRSVGFRWDEHAFASVHWVLTSVTITFLAVAVLMVAAVLVQLVTGLVDERRHLELTNAVVYVWFTLGTAIVLLSLVHVMPTVGG